MRVRPREVRNRPRPTSAMVQAEIQAMHFHSHHHAVKSALALSDSLDGYVDMQASVVGILSSISHILCVQRQ